MACRICRRSNHNARSCKKKRSRKLQRRNPKKRSRYSRHNPDQELAPWSRKIGATENVLIAKVASFCKSLREFQNADLDDNTRLRVGELQHALSKFWGGCRTA